MIYTRHVLCTSSCPMPTPFNVLNNLLTYTQTGESRVTSSSQKKLHLWSDLYPNGLVCLKTSKNWKLVKQSYFCQINILVPHCC